MVNPLDAIADRRSFVSHRLDTLEIESNALKFELKELDVAEQVFRRLDISKPPTEYRSEEQDLLDESSTQVKPPDIPTMPEMISATIGDFDVFGIGLEPKELVKGIATKWWPQVRPELVGPIAWRMAKRGQLIKEGVRYRLPKTGEISPAQLKSTEAAEQGS